MSHLLYPVGLIRAVQFVRQDRTNIDPFEAGNTAATRLWPAFCFKRRLTVRHSALRLQEYRHLLSFYHARGTAEAFWFRDNAGRRGNAKVRFAEPLAENLEKTVYDETIRLDEVAPIRQLPELPEVIEAAGMTPLLWWDANREVYIKHMGNFVQESETYDAVKEVYRAAWQDDSALNLGNPQGQWQYYQFTGDEWAKTAFNIAELAGAQPACTLFAFVRHSVTATKQVLFSVGAMGAGNAVGVALSAANEYEPWLGGSEAWAGPVLSNGAGGAWRSLAVSWPAASNTAKLTVNGASIGSAANTRSFTPGPAILGAAINGTLPQNPGGAMTYANLAHVMVFAGELTLAQIQAVHNLFAYQFGLTNV